MLTKESFIKKLPNGKYQILSEKGKNLGIFDSKSKAKKRLAQIEMFKHMKKKKAALGSISDSIIKDDDLTTNTFSSTTRDINKKNPEDVKDFMKSFKDSFNRALEEDLEDPDCLALMQVMKNPKESSSNSKMIKIAQTLVEMGNPELAGKAISNVIKFLITKMPESERSNAVQRIRNELLSLPVNEISSKKMPASASIGQSISLIKNTLSGKDPDFIRKVIENATRNM